MNPVILKHLLRYYISILCIAILSVGGCDIDFGGTGSDSGGNGTTTGNVTIEGTITNFAEFSKITVTATLNNVRLDRTTTDDLGYFKLDFRSSNQDITLEFKADNFNAERPNIAVVGNSTTTLDITLQQDPSLISIDRWQVFQDTLSLLDDTVLNFNESEVEFNIEGNGGNCIFAGGNSSITYIVKSISIIDCREGIRTQSEGSVILQADESIVVSSSQDAILTFDDSSVEIGQTTDPINNTIVIESTNGYGINAAGDSSVTINPENECSISGSSGGVNDFASGSVDSSTCTVSL